MPAEFIGLEAIKENLEKFNFDAIGVYQKKLEKFKKVKAEGDNEDNLVEAFEDWANRMLLSNPNNYQIYSVQLYELPDGASRLKGGVSFTFQLIDQPANNPFQKNKYPEIAGGGITKEYLEMALKNQRLEMEISQLKNELLEADQYDEEGDEEEAVGVIGAIEKAAVDKLPQLLDLAIGFFTPKTVNASKVALSGNVDDLINEFKQHDPDIEADLYKLLQVAKTNPQLFNMLINQLRTM